MFHHRFLTFCLAVIVVLVAVTLYGMQPGIVTAQRHVEYLVDQPPMVQGRPSAEDMTKYMNSMAAKGWRLHSFIEIGAMFVWEKQRGPNEFAAQNYPQSLRRGFSSGSHPVQLSDADRARDLVLGKRKISARDAIHIAVMERNGIKRILSFDSGFDCVSGVTRISEQPVNDRAGVVRHPRTSTDYMAISIGTQLGSQEITALLGMGGMGEVYRARDMKLKRDVAIKSGQRNAAGIDFRHLLPETTGERRPPVQIPGSRSIAPGRQDKVPLELFNPGFRSADLFVAPLTRFFLPAAPVAQLEIKIVVRDRGRAVPEEPAFRSTPLISSSFE